MRTYIKNWKNALTVANALRKDQKIVIHEDGSVSIIINRKLGE